MRLYPILRQKFSDLVLHEDWRIILIVAAFAVPCAAIIGVGELYSDAMNAAIAALALLVALAVYMMPRIRTLLLVILAVLSGAIVSQNRLAHLPENEVQRETFISFVGETVLIEYRPSKPTRLTLLITTSSKLEWLQGQKVRLNVRTEIPAKLKVGDTVALRAILEPLLGRLVPGGFNFARHSRLQGIAAQGFAVSPVTLENGAQSNDGLAAWIENRRNATAEKVLAVIEQPLGGIAVALITGQRQYLDKRLAGNMRDAGLAHLLAISGLHMGLITGAAFFVFELLFAAFMPLSMRFQPRKVAACAAWLTAFAYLWLSGAGTSTVRAFIMVSIAILAVLTDRRVISLRSVSIAALVILILAPEAIFSIGFQMSFAATIGIVIAYDVYRSRRNNEGREHRTLGWWRKPLRYIGAAAGTSLVSQIAITPIALYHFQSISIVAVVSNIVAVPLMAFLIMPAALISMVLPVAGLDNLFLSVMEQGLWLMSKIAEIAATAPLSVYRGGPYGGAFLAVSGVAIVLIMLLPNMRVITVSGVLVALIGSLAVSRPADVLIDGGGRIIAVRSDDNVMSIIGGRRGGFRDDVWQRYWNMRVGAETQRLKRNCDGRACMVSIAGLHTATNVSPSIRLVRSQSLDTTRRACSGGHIVLASYTHRNFCRGDGLFIAIEDIERAGPVALWADSSRGGASVRHRFANPGRLRFPERSNQ